MNKGLEQAVLERKTMNVRAIQFKRLLLSLAIKVNKSHSEISLYPFQKGCYSKDNEWGQGQMEWVGGIQK